LWLLARNLHNRPRLILMLWTSLGIISCLNIVPIPTQFASPYRAGIPLLGIAGLVGSWLAPDTRLQSRVALPFKQNTSAGRAGLLVLITIWWAIISVRDVPNWRDEYALMKSEVAADPNFVCARAALGSFEAQYGNEREALRQFEICTSELFGPNTPPEKYAEVITTDEMARKMHSASTLRYRAVQYIPQVVREQGRALMALGRPREAMPYLKGVLQLTPGDAVARAALADCYRAMGENGKADAVQHMDDLLLGRPL
jgi:hypothetical protein